MERAYGRILLWSMHDIRSSLDRIGNGGNFKKEGKLIRAICKRLDQIGLETCYPEEKKSNKKDFIFCPRCDGEGVIKVVR